MEEIQQLVADNMRKYRKMRGLSQEGLAAECDLHRTYVSGIERGVRNPTIISIARIAKALEIEPAKLLE